MAVQQVQQLPPDFIKDLGLKYLSLNLQFLYNFYI